MTDAEVVKEQRHELANCQECDLNEPGNAFVPTLYPQGRAASYRAIIIGEGPGFQEGVHKVPFSGPSGKLLDATLGNAGVKRDDCILTNTVLCRPPNNRTPTPNEVRCCWGRLKSEVDEADAPTIVTLGNTATQAVLGTREGITAVRVGPPKPSPYFKDKQVIPTVHPAACLRQGDFFPYFVRDLEKLRPQQVVIKWEPPKYKVFDDASASQVIKELASERYPDIVLDIEVGVDKDLGGTHPERYDFLCIGIGYTPGGVVTIGEEAMRLPEVQRSIKHLLEDPKKRLICHNGMFDIKALLRFGKGKLGFDTMLASYALDERPGVHGLEYCGVEHLGTPSWKGALDPYLDTKNKNYSSVPRDILYKYNALDVGVTWDLVTYFTQKMIEDDTLRVHDHLVAASNWLMYCELEGIAFDLEYNQELFTKYEGSLTVLEEQLKPWVANPRSPKQVKEALHDMGFKVMSTDEETLRSIYDPDEGTGRVSPESQEALFIKLMLQQRKEQKSYGTYVKGLRRRVYKGRIHTSFRLHGTTTGRLASRYPNLQNVTRGSELRNQFVAGPGKLFVQADYAAVELRVQTTLAQDAYMRDVLSDPTRDIHSEVATQFFGPNFTKEQRVRAKAVVYGLSYGREAASLAAEFGIPVAEAQAYLNAFFGMIPDTANYLADLKHRIWHDQDDLVTSFGRKRRFWLITKDNQHDVLKEGYAFLPQSTASDICLTAGGRLRLDHGLSVRLPVHDSLLVECEEDDARDVAALMSRVMEETAKEVFSDYVPFPVEANIGKRWGEV